MRRVGGQECSCSKEYLQHEEEFVRLETPEQLRPGQGRAEFCFECGVWDDRGQHSGCFEEFVRREGKTIRHTALENLRQQQAKAEFCFGCGVRRVLGQDCSCFEVFVRQTAAEWSRQDQAQLQHQPQQYTTMRQAPKAAHAHLNGGARATDDGGRTMPASRQIRSERYTTPENAGLAQSLSQVEAWLRACEAEDSQHHPQSPENLAVQMLW